MGMLAQCGPAAFAQQGAPPRAGEMRALLVGIDEYQYVPRLKGSAADIRDLESTLRNLGVRDLRVMLNAAATRGSLLVEMDAIAQRAQAGDTVFLSLSGHGAQEPERVKGSEPDGMDEVFLLAGFDPASRERNGEKILDKEFNHFVKKVEERGARVLFVADTCSGGGLARSVDPRGEEMSYRAVKYTAIADNLTPVSSRTDALMSPADFKASSFLAAVDKQSKAPEIRVAGVGYRGALSYAVARGLEGAADLNGDGRITTAELFEYTRRVTYQLSDQRQHIVTVGAEGKDAAQDVIVQMDRGISVQGIEPGKPPVGQAPPPVPSTSSQKPPAGSTQSPPPAPKANNAAAPSPAAGAAIRVASLDGQASHFSGLSLQIPFQVVAANDSPDMVWDPAKRDVLVGGDVIARNISRNDLPSVIERMAAVRLLKARATRSPQAIRVNPDDKLHRKGSRVEVEVGGLAGRSLIMFNIAGDGTVQLLYPKGSDPSMRSEGTYRIQFAVSEPLGADQIVALTAPRRMNELEQAVKQLDNRRNPMKLSELINQQTGSDILVGAAGLFTAP